MEIVVIIGALIALAVAAWRWGIDSTDAVDSPEWERRRQWRGLAPAGSPEESRQ